MARDKVLPHLVAYDISCPLRLGRVFRFLKKRGLHVQYSVFLVGLRAERVDHLQRELEALVAPDDDVRIYTLPAEPYWSTFGRNTAADGVVLHGTLGFTGRDENDR